MMKSKRLIKNWLSSTILTETVQKQMQKKIKLPESSKISQKLMEFCLIKIREKSTTLANQISMETLMEIMTK